ncbi:lipase family protein [Pseudodesulfovibrio sp.]|uniref:lipase family protein n=1 Tax=Pseudodesulfovibrio sp. TaxID=2035812 RepID=UPI002636CFB4|nr:lipase family protein [Pseudodesulfovibrio sp.]MDD3311199.1 lipase family protein [Pseudodesulfovibrio sp.]
MKEVINVQKMAGKVGDWGDANFSWEKALVAAEVARLAYLHIPQFELKNANRVNLIPCAGYRSTVKVSGVTNIRSISNANEMVFVVESALVVAVVVHVGSVDFISLRGTQKLYDWFVNLNILKSNPSYKKNMTVYFHGGFYKAIIGCLGQIATEVDRRFGGNNPIYVTGHSLGGALAAILHALCDERRYMKCGCDMDYFLGFYIDRMFSTESCYTFGMPRYGNLKAVLYFRNPFHIFNEYDIVPSVPPRKFGYSDCFNEKCLSADGHVNENIVRRGSFKKFIYKLATMKGFAEHDIELYIDRVGKAVVGA